MRHHLADGAGWADRSEEEHDEVAQTLVAIEGAEDGSAEERDQLAALIDGVRRHVKEEEQQIFPGLRKALDAEELDRLGEHLAAAKKVAPTRPHPHAPSEGLGTAAAGAVAAPIDRLKDKIQGR